MTVACCNIVAVKCEHDDGCGRKNKNMRQFGVAHEI